MLRLAQDAALAGQLGRAARERIESEFSMERRIGRLWAIIESAIHGRAAALEPEPTAPAAAAALNPAAAVADR
jgi:hypothetical protein